MSFQLYEASLFPIEALPEWARRCFPGVERLNRLQSSVFQAAFHSNKSLLVSAPTGAGKTNVAVLAILQQVYEHRHLQDSSSFRKGRRRPDSDSHREEEEEGGGGETAPAEAESRHPRQEGDAGRLQEEDVSVPSSSSLHRRGVSDMTNGEESGSQSRHFRREEEGGEGIRGPGVQTFRAPSARLFKAVYIAPMKSLVTEVVEKLSKPLSALGLVVKEMTGDVSLSRQELESAHVIVTVPEKWDILTRNAKSINLGGGGGGGEGKQAKNRHPQADHADTDDTEERTLMRVVKCLLIDEIHLLDDERGPVLESIVARTLRHVETSQTHTRLVGISATLPNW